MIKCEYCDLREGFVHERQKMSGLVKQIICKECFLKAYGEEYNDKDGVYPNGPCK